MRIKKIAFYFVYEGIRDVYCRIRGGSGAAQRRIAGGLEMAWR
jgi:hypothetical protein